MPEAEPQPALPGKPGDEPILVPELSTQTSDTYVLWDGSYRKEIAAAPINYEDSDGDWKPIDNTLVDAPGTRYAVENAAADYVAKFPSDAGSTPVTMTVDGGFWVSMKMHGLDGSPEVVGDTATFDQVQNADTVEYRATGSGVKESIMLEQPPTGSHPLIYRYDIGAAPGYSAQLVPTLGVQLVGTDGEVHATIPIGEMFDSASSPVSRGTGEYSLAETATGWVLSMTPSLSWLQSPDRVYPVTIDPNLGYGSPRDCVLKSAAPSSSFCWNANERLQVGRDDANHQYRSLLKFSLADNPIPATSTITAAILVMTKVPGQGVGTQYYGAYTPNSAWNEYASWNASGIGWPWTGGSATGPSSPTYVFGPGNGQDWYDVTTIVNSWYTDPSSYRGILLSPAQQNNAKVVYYPRSDTNAPPVLVVGYQPHNPPVFVSYLQHTCAHAGSNDGSATVWFKNPDANGDIAAPLYAGLNGQTTSWNPIPSGTTGGWVVNNFAPGTHSGYATLGSPVNATTFFNIPIAQCAAPTLTVSNPQCANTGQSNGTIAATVTNPNPQAVTLTLTAGGSTWSTSIAGNATVSRTFSSPGYAIGSYNVTATLGASVSLLTTKSVAVAKCPDPYEPPAFVDDFPETAGQGLPTEAEGGSGTTSIDDSSSSQQSVPGSTGGSALIGLDWLSSTPLSLRPLQLNVPVGGPETLNDEVDWQLTPRGAGSVPGELGSVEADVITTPALQIDLQTIVDNAVTGLGDGLEAKLDYGAFAKAFGGNWSDRLMVVGYPACYATTPLVAGCSDWVVVPSVNDAGAQTLSFTAAPPLRGGETPPAAPAPGELDTCLPGAGGMSQPWARDPNGPEAENPETTSDPAVTSDETDNPGGFDESNNANDAASDDAGSQDVGATENADARSQQVAPSNGAACRGMSYQVRGGTGSYGRVAAAGDGGDSGASQAATSLAPNASWQVGEGSGNFSWSYPFVFPKDQAGNAPSLGLTYSSGSVDGMGGPESSQASQAGLGWTLEPGHISRSFAACADDGEPSKGDMCWRTDPSDGLVDDLSLVLEGHATKLIRDEVSGQYRLQDDPGWKVEYSGGPDTTVWVDDDPAPDNADGDDEAFRIVSPDGTEYYFGYYSDSKSVWTVPVAGNNAGEPCFGSPIASSSCKQAWQWNLDKVVDPNGNRTRYFYETETNHYAANRATGGPTVYDRAGRLTYVKYGYPKGLTRDQDEPRVVVDIESAQRCTEKLTNPENDKCKGDGPRDMPKEWPDVPTDLICGPQSCDTISPSFFSTYRYHQVVTRGEPGSAGPNTRSVIDRYTLIHTMPDPDGEGGDDADLWLDQIQHGGSTGATQGGGDDILPNVKFGGRALPNLVVSKGGGKNQEKFRLNMIRNEMGGRTSVEYGHSKDRRCDKTYLQTSNGPRDAWASDRECFAPRNASSPGNLTWYHKYVTLAVTLGDRALALANVPTGRTSLGTVRRYQYIYRDEPAWRFDGASMNTPMKYRSWSDWRGYETTLVKTMRVEKDKPGTPTTTAKSVRKVTVYRGMHGSKANNTDAYPDRYISTKERGDKHLENLPDRNALAGRIVEEAVLGTAGTWLSRTYHGYQTLQTAQNNLGLKARFTGENLTRTHTHVFSNPGNGTGVGSDRRHTVTTEFDNGGSNHRGLLLGAVTNVTDRGASASNSLPGDKNVCTETTWAANSQNGNWLRAPIRSKVIDNNCTNLRSQTESFYEVAETQQGNDLTKGRLTRVDTLVRSSPSAAWITTRSTYDDYGRVVQTKDGNGNVTDISYNLTQAGTTANDLVNKVVTQVNPGLLEERRTETLLNPERSLPTSIRDVDNNATTSMTYDGYGRLTKIRSPQLNQDDPTGAASVEYTYKVTAGSPSRVQTRTRRQADLGAAGFDESYDFIDGWGRTIESQSLQADDEGRVVAATAYDELGLPYQSMPVIANGEDPGFDLLNAKPDSVTRSTRSDYDALGRVTEIVNRAGNSVHDTTTITHQGDRTITLPPAGGRTSISVDGWGRTSSVQQLERTTATTIHAATYAYDGVGNLTSIASTIDGSPRTWAYTYDLAGRRTHTEDPDTGASDATFDANGNQVTASTPVDGIVKTAYDRLNRSKRRFTVKAGTTPDTVTDCPSETSSCKPLAAWTYDTATRGDGLLRSATSYTHMGNYTRTINGYDLNGNVTGLTYTYPGDITSLPATGAMTMDQSWTYNEANLVKTTNYGAINNLAPMRVDTTYGANAQVDTMTAVQAGQANVTLLDATYDKVGRARRALSEGSNAGRHLNREYDWSNSTGELTRVGGSIFGTLDYTYDLVGNPTGITSHNLYSAPTPDTVTAAWCYTYDAVNRLKTVKTGASDTNGCASPASDTTLIGAHQNLSYSYSNDRLTQVNNVANSTSSTYNPSPTRPHQTTSISGSNDAALPKPGSWVYDANGRAVTWTPASGLSTTYTYDPTGTLHSAATGAGTSDFAYDPDGIRTADRAATGGDSQTTVYMGESELYTWVDPGYGGVKARRVLTTPGGKPLAVMTGSGQAYPYGAGVPEWTFVLGDAQNSVRLSRSQASAVDARATYRPFGDSITTAAAGNRGYLNKATDSNGDLRLDQRNYRPNLNLLTTPDVLLQPEDPQSLNPYAYARNNPVTFVDPSGLKFDDNVTDTGCTAYGAGCVPTDYIAAPGLGYEDHQEEAVAAYQATNVDQGAAAVKSLYNFYIGDTINDCDNDLVSAMCGVGVVTSIPGVNLLKFAKYGDDAVGLAQSVLRHSDDVDEGLDVASTSARAAENCMNSFTGNTLVLMADGTSKAIKDVNVGDEVIATDPVTRIHGPRKVMNVIRHGGAHAMVAVHLSDGTVIDATDRHPFWITNRGAPGRWIDAVDLRSGDRVETADGGVVLVESIRTQSEDVRAFNLSIEGLHTYFVGDRPVLVHNTSCPTGLRAASPGLRSLFKDGTVRGRLISNIRADLFSDGFTQGVTRNKSGYLFTNGTKEQVRIMRRGGGWDIRITNSAGNHLDEFGNVAPNDLTHEIEVYL